MKEPDYEQLTLFPAGSRASLFPLPGSEEARMMTVTSGRRCSELYRRSGPLGSLVRTLLESSGWHSTRCCLTWKMRDTPQKKFERIETYGPKLVENITQAISRDILAHAMKTLCEERIVGHVHDEIILEAEKDASVQDICEQMGRTPAWISGLVLRADGYECDYYRKD